MRVQKRLIELEHCVNILKKEKDITKPTTGDGVPVVLQTLKNIFDILKSTLTPEELDEFIQ